MRKEIKDRQLDCVTGGTVSFSFDYGDVGFSTLRELYPIKNTDVRTARDFVEDLLFQNPGMGDSEFDLLAKEELQKKGWI